MSLSVTLSWLIAYKYYILLPVAIIEGPIIAVLAGFLVYLGAMNFYVAYLIVVLGDFIGDLLYYAIGALFSRSFIMKHGHYFGVTPKRFAYFDEQFKKHPLKILLFGKFSHVFGGATLVMSGMLRMNLWKFILYTTAGTLPKTIFFLIIGFFFGGSYELINNYIDYGSYIVLFIFIIFVLACYLIPKFLRERL